MIGTMTSCLSIHAPTRGATSAQPFFIHIINFQSTLLQEERQFLFPVMHWTGLLSIHAPTRGATIQRHLHCADKIAFNPRSYKRSDAPAQQGLLPHAVFQSTLLQEERQGRVTPAFYIMLSIHAPTRGATIQHAKSYAYRNLSIHAPTRGATKDRDGQAGVTVSFNPRSYKRSDFLILIKIQL